MEIEEVRKEVEELYRELVRRKYERARKKGASEQALANFIALHEEFLPAFVEKEMKWIETIEEEEKREGDCLLRRWPAGAKQLIRRTNCCGSAISYKNFDSHYIRMAHPRRRNRHYMFCRKLGTNHFDSRQ